MAYHKCRDCCVRCGAVTRNRILCKECLEKLFRLYGKSGVVCKSL